MEVKLIILKIGGSLITHKDSVDPSFDVASMSRIAKEIKTALNSLSDHKIILVHGAGSFGHSIVKKNKLNKGVKDKNQLLELAKTQILQNELNNLVCEILTAEGVRAFPFQASATSVMRNKNIESFNLDSLLGLLTLGVVPVLSGTPAFDSSMGVSILSGDEIIAKFVKELDNCFKIERVLFATDVDGIFSKDPNIYPDAKKISHVYSLTQAEISKSTNTDVTFGMLGKVQKIFSYNKATRIFSGRVPGNISKALLGDSVGTLIKQE